MPNRQTPYITIKTSKKNFTKQKRPFVLTKYAKHNKSHQTTYILQSTATIKKAQKTKCMYIYLYLKLHSLYETQRLVFTRRIVFYPEGGVLPGRWFFTWKMVCYPEDGVYPEGSVLT
jgi:hypothetical protein